MCNLSSFSLSAVGLLNLGLLNRRFIRKFAPMASTFGVTIMTKCLSSFWAKNAPPLFSWFWMNLLKFQLIEPLELIKTNVMFFPMISHLLLYHVVDPIWTKSSYKWTFSNTAKKRVKCWTNCLIFWYLTWFKTNFWCVSCHILLDFMLFKLESPLH